jgi:transcriptional regulator with XRE-family HTH domain
MHFNVPLEASLVTLQEIGRFLKDARKRAKLSQEQLAHPLGMSRATISALESGRCEEIGFAKLAALFDSLGLEITICPRKSRPTIDDLRAERRS